LGPGGAPRNPGPSDIFFNNNDPLSGVTKKNKKGGNRDPLTQTNKPKVCYFRPATQTIWESAAFPRGGLCSRKTRTFLTFPVGKGWGGRRNTIWCCVSKPPFSRHAATGGGWGGTALRGGNIPDLKFAKRWASRDTGARFGRKRQGAFIQGFEGGGGPKNGGGGAGGRPGRGALVKREHSFIKNPQRPT